MENGGEGLNEWIIDGEHWVIEGDHFYAPYEETYPNIYKKVICMLEYFLKEGIYDRFIKIDDDIFLNDQVEPEDLIRWALIGDYSGLSMIKHKSSMERFHKNHLKDMHGLDFYNYDKDSFVVGTGGLLYGLSHRCIRLMYPKIKELSKYIFPDDHLISEVFNEMKDKYFLSRFFTNEYIKNLAKYDTKCKHGIVECTHLFKAAYVRTVGTKHNKPKVSCICPTFGRSDFLQEAVYHFLSQSYPNKELIVINDNPNIQYVIPYKNVIVVNTNSIFPTLGEKRNYGIAMATGKYIVPWDDDDIHLPERLSCLVDGITSKKDSRYYADRRCYEWCLESDEFNECGREARHGGGYATNIFDRSTVLKVGGYGKTNRSEDSILWKRLASYGVDMSIDRTPLPYPLYIIQKSLEYSSRSHNSIKELYTAIGKKGIEVIHPQISKRTYRVLDKLSKLF